MLLVEDWKEKQHCFIRRSKKALNLSLDAVFNPMTLVLLHTFHSISPLPFLILSQSDYSIQMVIKFTYLMANSADPDQLLSSWASLASSVVNWFGSTDRSKAVLCCRSSVFVRRMFHMRHSFFQYLFLIDFFWCLGESVLRDFGLFPGYLIKKKSLYNVDPPWIPLLYSKLGFTGEYIIFLISAQKHSLWELARTASLRRF